MESAAQPTLLSQTEEWADVEPLPLPTDARAAVNIQYSAEYEDTFGLLYACMQKGEKSLRVLKLTEACIDLSNSHYTAWDYRFQCILETGADMEYEWQLCWAIGLSSAKNYQLWNHRRRCAMHLGAANAQRELEFAAHFLAEDAKNYHIWAHRQAVVAAFGCWEDEWHFMESMLREDLRNNSAWAQRAFLVIHRLVSCLHCAALAAGSPIQESACASLGDDGSGAFLQAALAAQEPSTTEQASADRKPSECLGSKQSEGVPAANIEKIEFVTECIRKEVEFTANCALAMAHNESAWNYLCGLVHLLSSALSRCLSPEAAEEVLQNVLASYEDAQGDSYKGGECCEPTIDSQGHSRGGRQCVEPVIEAQAGVFLASLPEAVRKDVLSAVHVAMQGTFVAAFEVLDVCPGCIPARVALLRTYVVSAGMVKESGDLVRARDAAMILADGLSKADPLRKGWYSSLVQSLSRDIASS